MNASSTPTVDEIQALLQAEDLENKEAVSQEETKTVHPIRGASLPVFTPAEFWVKDREEPFLCWETGAWAYTETGILACGRWESDPEGTERDILFGYGQIRWIEFHFEAVEHIKETLSDGEDGPSD